MRQSDPARRKPSWSAIRLAYQAKEGSLRELAKRFNVSFHTLAKRCKRETWRQEAERLGDVVATEATRVAKEEGQALALTAAQLAVRRNKFVLRSIEEANEWLDDILSAKQMLQAGDIEGLKALVNAWKVPLEAGRRALGLDDAPASAGCVVNIALLKAAEGELSPEASIGEPDRSSS